MENDELIERLVVFVADALEQNADPITIQDTLAKEQLPENIEVELILIAGKILYGHRKSAPPKKTLIRRIP